MNKEFAVPQDTHFALSAVVDKWVLSSALQKSIRRGLAAQSQALSIRLHEIDPTYLRKRLPIITLEDIGLADAEVCQKVLEVCGSARWWREPTETIESLTTLMATAVKSRGACDAFCLTEVHPDRATVFAKLLPESPDKLIEVACDSGLPTLERLCALRVLGGIKGDNYRTVSRYNPGALDAIADSLGLPPTVRVLMAGQLKTLGLAAMLPVVYELGQGHTTRQGREFPGAMETVAGIPLCALDQYTRVGKAALKAFYEGSQALKDFVHAHVRNARPQALINLAMFQAESSLLDRYLSSPGLDALNSDTEDAELLELGLADAPLRWPLYGVLSQNAGALTVIRKRMLDRMFPSEAGRHEPSPMVTVSRN